MISDFENLIEHELKNNGRVCIHGVPGSGKTYFCKDYCKSRDYITVYIDCKTDRLVLKQILELKNAEDFSEAFKEYAGLSKFKNEKIYLIFDNIDTSKYFSKIYMNFRNNNFVLIMTFCVKNNNTFLAESDCNVVVKRPYSFFDVNDVYNDTITYETYKQLLDNKEIPKFVHNTIDKIYSDYLNYGGTGAIYQKFKNDNLDEDEIDQYFQCQFDYTLNRIFKYSDLSDSEITLCRKILFAIAYQMLKDKQYSRFNYSNIEKGMTFNKCSKALSFLIDNNILYKVEHKDVQNNNLYYFYDCGILRYYILQLSNECDVDYDEAKISTILSKNFVTAELIHKVGNIYHWKSNNTAVVDFIFDINDTSYAVNVVDAEAGHSIALDLYNKTHANCHILCLSSENYNSKKKIINFPIFSISCIVL